MAAASNEARKGVCGQVIWGGCNASSSAWAIGDRGTGVRGTEADVVAAAAAATAAKAGRVARRQRLETMADLK